jgi:hypothetical protein
MFDSEGFPIFNSYFDMHLNPVDYMRTRGVHFNRASKALYQEILRNPTLKNILKLTDQEVDDLALGIEPKRFTWHHHQDTGRMQLVDFADHDPVYHGGGYSIWGKGN